MAVLLEDYFKEKGIVSSGQVLMSLKRAEKRSISAGEERQEHEKTTGRVVKQWKIFHQERALKRAEANTSS